MADIQTTMPAEYYLNAIEDKKLLQDDIQRILDNRGIHKEAKTFINEFKLKDYRSLSQHKAQTLAEVARKTSAANWPDFMLDSITSWVSSFWTQIKPNGKMESKT